MPLKKGKSNIPEVEPEDTDQFEIVDEPPAEDQYAAQFFTRKSDGQKYALCVRLTDPRGKTHWLRNSLRTWCGTEAEFKDQFEKA